MFSRDTKTNKTSDLKESWPIISLLRLGCVDTARAYADLAEMKFLLTRSSIDDGGYAFLWYSRTMLISLVTLRNTSLEYSCL